MKPSIRRWVTTAALAIGLVGASAMVASPSFASTSNKTCPSSGDWTELGEAGKCIPGTSIVRMSWSGGGYRVFLIGADYNVWNIVQWSLGGSDSGWQNLGYDGYMNRGVYSVYSRGLYDVEIRAYSDLAGDWACRVPTTNGWQGWFVNTSCHP